MLEQVLDERVEGVGGRGGFAAVAGKQALRSHGRACPEVGNPQYIGCAARSGIPRRQRCCYNAGRGGSPRIAAR